MVFAGAAVIVHSCRLRVGLGSVDSVARDVIKAEELVDYTVKEKFTERLARRFGAMLGNSVASVLAQAKLH